MQGPVKIWPDTALKSQITMLKLQTISKLQIPKRGASATRDQNISFTYWMFSSYSFCFEF
jgi:hypothetical protein